MRTIFVDGYNVINSWSDLKKIKNYDLDSARKKLFEVLQNYASYNGYRVFIVYDAHLVVGGIEKKEKYGNVVVVYTKEGEIADSYIEKIVDGIGRKAEVFVVTSDNLEQQTTFQRGAIRMSSIEFYHAVKEAEKNISQKLDKRNKLVRNLLEDRIEEEVRDKLEKIRRSP